MLKKLIHFVEFFISLKEIFTKALQVKPTESFLKLLFNWSECL